MNYLIFLKDKTEAEAWMGQPTQDSLAAHALEEKNACKILGNEMISVNDLTVQNEGGWIMAALVSNNNAKSLANKLKGCSQQYRIFFHGGNLNCEETDWSNVQKRFNDLYGRASFPDNYMYFSKKGGFSWDPTIERAKREFLDNGPEAQIIGLLDKAWDLACEHFEVHKHVKAAAESFFPVAVAAVNHQAAPLSKEEWEEQIEQVDVSIQGNHLGQLFHKYQQLKQSVEQDSEELGDKVKEFKDEFDAVSKQLTKSLGFGDGH